MSSYHKRSADTAGLSNGESRHKSSRYDDDGPVKLHHSVSDKLKSLYSSDVVQEGDLDERALSQLGEFSPNTALDILDQFASCDMSTVRNKSAYLSGVMQRMRKYGGGREERDPVQRKLQQLISSGVMKRGDLDQRCLEALSEAPTDAALSALERFSSRGLADVRNPSAFLMSTLKKVEQDYTPSRGTSSAPAVNVPSLVPSMPGNLLPLSQSLLLPGAVSMQPTPVPGPLTGGLSLAYGAFDTLQNPSLQAPAAYVGSQAGPMVSANQVNNHSHRTDYGQQQRQFGVRVDEFWNLSEFARYVHPAPALKLQQLWDDGVRLVSLLDDRAWEVLADLGAAEGLIVVEDVANHLQQPTEIRNVNAFFMSVAKSYLSKNRARAVPQASSNHERPRQTSERHRGEGFHLLPSELAEKVEDLISRYPRFLNKKHFDEGVADMLTRMPVDDALDTLSELDNNDLSNVRNMPAYLMGICRRFTSRK